MIRKAEFLSFGRSSVNGSQTKIKEEKSMRPFGNGGKNVAMLKRQQNLHNLSCIKAEKAMTHTPKVLLPSLTNINLGRMLKSLCSVFR